MSWNFFLYFSIFVALLIYIRKKYKWILVFSVIMALVCIGIHIFKPEIHHIIMVPALQSPWFVPHVMVYMLAYAILGVAAVTAIYLLFFRKRDILNREVELCDNLIYTGVAFLTLGMLFGAFWAKEAWGHYWSWDPKERWAAATWLAYLVYIHFRLQEPAKYRTALTLMLLAFLALQICWYGINWLPTAGNSIHTYY